MKSILMIGTGGTIAAEDRGAGLSPVLSPGELLGRIPGVLSRCRVDAVQLMNIDSTNISPGRWLHMARCIRDNYGSYDGFVVVHGTDTMAYTAAALSYLIQRSAKPIILTGAQKPIGSESTDSLVNLQDAFQCACDGSLRGVFVAFDGKVILGTRARKTHSKSFQAFASINYPPVAVLLDGCMMRYIDFPPAEGPIFSGGLNERVALMKLYPGADAGVLEYLLEHNDAVIIESYGVGGIPSLPPSRFYEVIESAVRREGKTVVMTTQVPNEGSDLAVYSVGHDLKTELGLMEAYDMTTEAALAKLMWILSLTRDPDEVRRLFYTPVAADILYKK